jgi:hypothetical protein
MVMALYCPMGCGDTVHTDYDQDISCRAPDCPDPYAIEKLLSDPETEHISRINHEGEFVSTQHPLRERIDGSLLDCDMITHIVADVANDNAPTEEGTYRVIYVGHDPVSSSLHAPMCTWEKISDE